MIQIRRVIVSAFILMLIPALGCNRHERRDNRPDLTDPVPLEIYAKQPNSPVTGYAGSGTCETCHMSIFQRWRVSRHARGLSEQDRLAPPHQGGCNRCHWTTSREKHVGCEACHGPRAEHVRDPYGSVEADCTACEVLKKCIQCHNRSIDHDFNPAEEMTLIHHGKDGQKTIR